MSEEILYIVSDYVQWHEPIDLASICKYLIKRVFQYLFSRFCLQKKTSKKPSQNVIDYIGQYFPYFSSEKYSSNEPTWKFCIGGNGQVLSIVQQSTLEMRTEKHYNKTLAKATCKMYL